MLAEVTNNKSSMTAIGNKRFFLNRGVLVRDSDVIRRAQNTAGFSVQIIEPARPKKKKRKVVRNGSGETQRATSKKKTSRRK